MTTTSDKPDHSRPDTVLYNDEGRIRSAHGRILHETDAWITIELPATPRSSAKELRIAMRNVERIERGVRS